MSTRKPMILVLAGPNGSGKSTITQYFEKVGEYTNADDVVSATGMSNEEAATFVDNKRYHAIKMKQDYLPNTKWIFSEKQKAKDISSNAFSY